MNGLLVFIPETGVIVLCGFLLKILKIKGGDMVHELKTDFIRLDNYVNFIKGGNYGY